MKLNRYIFIVLNTILLNSIAIAQTYITPKDFFSFPMDTPLYLSGGFGDLRANHFHSGIDLKTNGKENMPVYSVMEGYVVRIKVSPYGYGKALYINHPNGYTTVYAHLNNFESKLDSFLYQYQKENKLNEFDVFPKKNQFYYKAGEIIAYSGNTGGSSGPHLHFEIRETKSEAIINPLLFNIPVFDTLSPKIKKIRIYKKDTEHLFNYYHYPFQNINSDTININAGTYSFGLLAQDFALESNYGIGVNYIQVLVNENSVFKRQVEKFEFHESRNVNLDFDYCDWRENGIRYIKTFKENSNNINFYEVFNNGWIDLKNGELKKIKIIIKDEKGKEDFKEFYLRSSNTQENNIENQCNTEHFAKSSAAVFYPARGLKAENKNIELELEKYALQDTFLIGFFEAKKNKKTYGPIYYFGSPLIPIKSYDLIVHWKNLPASKNPKKYILAGVTEKGSLYSLGGEFKGGELKAKLSAFPYAISLYYDSLAPKIFYFTIKKSNGNFQFFIKTADDFSGIDEYSILLNDEWIPAYYDAKKDLIYGEIRENLNTGKHSLSIIVVDKKKNIKKLSKNFIVE